jgi:two-component system, OmpR family, alkaline phosphatase synthesis response regulator PhoP
MKKPLILVVEDEPAVRELLVGALEFSNFDVIEAENGAEGVEETKKNMPDLIIMDVRMPIMTGFEACQILKAEESTKNIPVIFLSAYGQDAEVNTGLGLGAEEYLLKPFEVSNLIGLIKNVLRKHGKI